MARFRTVAFLLLLGIGMGMSVTASEAMSDDMTTVYVTKSGSKYHRDSCSYLKKSKVPMELEKAKKGYSPCSRCKPPKS